MVSRMDEWRKEWRRNGIGMIAAAFGLYVARLSGDHQVIVGSHGHLQVIPQPGSFLVWVFLALGLFGLYAWAATQINWMPMLGRRAARRPDCVLTLLRESVPEMTEPRHGIDYKGCTYLFLNVENTGDTAHFAAQFSNISGLRRGDNHPLDNYYGKVAWEDTVEDRQILGSKSQSKLMVMCLFGDPIACWFQIPYSAKWAPKNDRWSGQLAGWLLVPEVSGSHISFDIKVINETKKSSGDWNVNVVWNADGSVGSLTLTPK